MLQAADLRNGVYFLFNKQPFKVLEYKHTHLSRRGADIKVKARNLVSGNIKTFNFGSNQRFEEARVIKREMQFLYNQGEDFYFMDPQDYSQLKVGEKLIGEDKRFLKEGQKVDLLFWQEKPLRLELPVSVVVKINSCPPGVKGDSATASFKPAVADNGLKVKVPLFIKKGDRVKVDTRSGDYVERV